MPAPFEVQPRLTQIALAVKPMGLIADMVCPRVSVGGEKFTYTKGKTEESFTIPETAIGRTGNPNQVEFGAVDVTESTENYALEDRVPVQDIELARAQRANWDPLAEAAETATVLLELAREKRVADLLFAASSYPVGQTRALAGNSQWSDAASDPRAAVMEALDMPLVRPNTLVFGQAAWTAFRQHPKIVESVKSTGAGGDAVGVVARQQVAELFEIDQVTVGMSFYNTARKGQDASYSRIWGKHAALLHLNRSLASARSSIPTFCFTAEWRGRQAGTYSEPRPGRDGVENVKVVDSVKELIAWKEAGYFFQNVAA